MTAYNFEQGEVILIDKPLDWTSFDVVNKIKFALKKKYGKIKIGHAGTLDPKATGLLILCTGKKTKDIEAIQNADKVYTGSFFLGATTVCFDTEKEPNQTFDISGIKKFDITKIELPIIDFYVECTKGTYIRSLANDFGARLNNGAYLQSLRRTKIGNYNVTDAFTVEQFLEKI